MFITLLGQELSFSVNLYSTKHSGPLHLTGGSKCDCTTYKIMYILTLSILVPFEAELIEINGTAYKGYKSHSSCPLKCQVAILSLGKPTWRDSQYESELV